ncbi:hypothetical protein CJD36_008565 [Flavipsychrobacter stenotrophus]|uniref:Uncharacterized protein n=1 Tax=Flavipsychrobacter stenotrophus TaxID=2077091 RepID=A0A2S7SZ00_9BACT|nr:hypothetical protein [Flavipsychrobacter stenotrophus]PQJ11837.1 hypothetical protein CJD36_008565 [Flavipsychrobacter stenotrophus]
MSISERRNHIIEQINAIQDEETLSILEEAVVFYSTTNNIDITDGLTEKEFGELKAIVEEPSDKDIISEQEFQKMFSKWHTK